MPDNDRDYDSCDVLNLDSADELEDINCVITQNDTRK